MGSIKRTPRPLWRQPVNSGLAIPRLPGLSEEVTGSEMLAQYVIERAYAPLGGWTMWLHCGTSCNAAIPYECSGEWMSRTALFGADPTGVGANEVERTPIAKRLTKELHRTSGLTWVELAKVLEVDRRTLHLWADGATPSEANADRLQQVVATVRCLDQGDPKLTKRMLKSPGRTGESPVDLLKGQKFAEALAAAAPADIGDRRQRKRPPRLSDSVRAQRRVFEPVELLGAVPSDEYDHGSLLISFALDRSEGE